MIPKGSKLFSVLYNRCPRCQEGAMFVTSHPYSRRFTEMHRTCSHCGQRSEPEPGFYQGAMYVSYAINTPVAIATIVLMNILGASMTMITLATVLVSILVIPLSFRLSRLIWLNLFVRYQPGLLSDS